jgi:hypothetical protein
MLGSLLLTVFVNGVARWSSDPAWPTPEEDRAVLAQIHREMNHDFGHAWTGQSGSVLETNAPLHREMMDSFAQKLVDHYGPAKRHRRDNADVQTAVR